MKFKRLIRRSLSRTSEESDFGHAQRCRGGRVLAACRVHGSRFPGFQDGLGCPDQESVESRAQIIAVGDTYCA